MSATGATWMMALALVLGCDDPVKQAAIARLGGEQSAVPPGPRHRPGQPCTLCHDDAMAPALALGGTIFADQRQTTPLRNVQVKVTDARGRQFVALSNCSGNFFFRPQDLPATFPIWVSLAAGSDTIDMESPIYRDASCATCHHDPLAANSAGHVFLFPDPRPIPKELLCP